MKEISSLLSHLLIVRKFKAYGKQHQRLMSPKAPSAADALELAYNVIASLN